MRSVARWNRPWLVCRSGSAGAIALFHMEGLSGEEAARAMNLSAKAFKSLLARARATLRQHVEKIQNPRRYA